MGTHALARTRSAANRHAAVAGALGVGLTLVALVGFAYPRAAPYAGGAVAVYAVLFVAIAGALVAFVGSSGEEDAVDDE